MSAEQGLHLNLNYTIMLQSRTKDLEQIREI